MTCDDIRVHGGTRTVISVSDSGPKSESWAEGCPGITGRLRVELCCAGGALAVREGGSEVLEEQCSPLSVCARRQRRSLSLGLCFPVMSSTCMDNNYEKSKRRQREKREEILGQAKGEGE